LSRKVNPRAQSMSAWASGKKRAKKSSRYSSRASFQGLSKSMGV